MTTTPWLGMAATLFAALSPPPPPPLSNEIQPGAVAIDDALASEHFNDVRRDPPPSSNEVRHPGPNAVRPPTSDNSNQNEFNRSQNGEQETETPSVVNPTEPVVAHVVSEAPVSDDHNTNTQRPLVIKVSCCVLQ